MNHWDFVITAYAVSILGVGWVISYSLRRLSVAERRLQQINQDR